MIDEITAVDSFLVKNGLLVSGGVGYSNYKYEANNQKNISPFLSVDVSLTYSFRIKTIWKMVYCLLGELSAF